jgi:hypothetical protein
VIELGSCGSALMEGNEIGWLRTPFIVDVSIWVPSVAAATVNATASEPAIMPVTVTRDDAMPKAVAISIANALLNAGNADEPAAVSAAMSPGIVILATTAGWACCVVELDNEHEGAPTEEVLPLWQLEHELAVVPPVLERYLPEAHAVQLVEVCELADW